jgi:hypothetical protein
LSLFDLCSIMLGLPPGIALFDLLNPEVGPAPRRGVARRPVDRLLSSTANGRIGVQPAGLSCKFSCFFRKRPSRRRLDAHSHPRGRSESRAAGAVSVPRVAPAPAGDLDLVARA